MRLEAKIGRGALVLLMLLAVTACSRNARLYNMDSGEVLQLKFTDNPGPGGKMSVTMPWGEILSGEYTVLRGGAVQWGSIYALAYGPGGSASGQAFGSSGSMDRLNRGHAIATGPDGTILECEFVASSTAGNAHGACRDNKGNTYRLVV